MPTFGFGSTSEDFDLLLKKPNVVAATVLGSVATQSESAKISAPLIWNQENDTYYEQTLDGYYRFVGAPTQITTTNGYKYEPDLTVHSYIKVCNMWEDGTVMYYITLDPSSFQGNSGATTSGLTNSTVGKIAGSADFIICDFTSNNTLTIANANDGFRSYQSSTRLQINGIDQYPNYSYSYTALSQTNHMLITGNKIRCIEIGTSNLTLNKIYYVIKQTNTTFRLANTYQDAINNIPISITSGVNITFFRQSGWILVEEGGIEYGNGGSPLYGGKGNRYIRNTYDLTTKTSSMLPSYNSSVNYAPGDRVIHSIVVNNQTVTLVWECLDYQDSSNAISPALGIVDADMSGIAGDTFLEIPEFYVRKDHFDGFKWTNVKGKDVSKDYTLLSTSNSLLGLTVSPLSTGEKQDLHFTWLIHKSQFNKLSDQEKSKYLLHPLFMLESDSLLDRTYRLTAEEAGLFMPSGSVHSTTSTNSTLSSIHNNYLVVGKSIIYDNPSNFSDTVFATINLPVGTYYVSNIINSKEFNISLSKGGSSITTINNNYHLTGNGKKGYFAPIVTKTSQIIVNISSGSGGGASFTTQEDHQFLIGQKVELFFQGLINNFTNGTTYYVTNPNYTNFTFSLASSLNNAVNNIPIQFNSFNNTSNVYVVPEVILEDSNPRLTINSLSGTDSLNLDWLPGYTTHFLRTGDAIVFEGNLNGLSNGSVYYVIQVNWEFTIKLAVSYENAMLNIPITGLSGSVEGSTIKRAEYTDIQISGSRRNIITVNQQIDKNSYRVAYKGLFNGGVDVLTREVESISTVNSQPLIFTVTNHGLTRSNTLYLIYSERCNLVNFGRYHPLPLYWVIPIDLNTFQLATTQNGSPINYNSSSSSWSEFVSTGGMKVQIYKANSIKIKNLQHSNLGLSLGILGVGNNNDITLCVESADEALYNFSYSQFFRTGQQVTYGIYRVRQGARGPAEYSTLGITQITQNSPGTLFRTGANSFIRDNLKIRFRSVGSLTGLDTSTIYRVVDKDNVTGDFRLVNNSSNTYINVTGSVGSASIKPIIFDEIMPGNYFIRSGPSNNTITLHRTYNDSLSGQNPVLISSQPNYRNSQSQNDTGAPTYNFYGQFRRDTDALSIDNNSIVNNLASTTEATNKNLNYYKGSNFIDQAMRLLGYQEVRLYTAGSTQAVPFTRSNRVSLFFFTVGWLCYEDNNLTSINYSIPSKNKAVLCLSIVTGLRYNSLLGCVVMNKNITSRFNYAKTSDKTGISFVYSIPKGNSSTSVGLGNTGLYFPYVHYNTVRFSSVFNTSYTYLIEMSFSQGHQLQSLWQYFLCR